MITFSLATALLGGLIHLLIVLLILGVCFWLVWWALSFLPIGEPFASVIRFVVVLIFVVILIGYLLPLAGIGSMG